MSVYLELFITFAKIGVSTFGGGLAMLPIIQQEVVEKKKWSTQEELSDCYAISQCTPGVIAVNTATFIGFKRGGVFGGILATLGVVFPSIIIISLIAALITNFADLEVVKNAFTGLRACLCALILNSVIKLWKSTVIGKTAIIIFAVVFILASFTNLSVVLLILAAGIAGLVINAIASARRKTK